MFPPLIQTSSRYFSRLKRLCRKQTLTSTEHHISSLQSHLLVQLRAGSAFPLPDKKYIFLRFFIIRIRCRVGTCSSTHLYKLPDFTYTDSSMYAVHTHSPAQNVIFQVYTHICGSSKVQEVSFSSPPITTNLCDSLS